ncbi:MAG TPA: inorganic phosphate transporter [Chloroflexota bacterium]|nr:inorganic phosphate transporter [Chloroflexota bacterium]
MSLAAIILLVVSLVFAWSMGAHYTGAVMGMPFSSHAIRMGPALGLMSILTVIGATFASSGVQTTVGLKIVDAHTVTILAATVMVLSAAILTSIYTYYKIPSSTIQIFVFSIVGTGLAAHLVIHWDTILHLAVLWVLAPIVAVILGFVFTHLFDLIVPPTEAAEETRLVAGVVTTPTLVKAVSGTARVLPVCLVVVGCAASFTLGANDVSNAVGVFGMVNLTSTTIADFLGGLAMAIGALTWGQGILKKVAFDVVRTDLSMASAAQAVQAIVVLLAVSQGLFTSMNQALIGAMTGTGLARGNDTIRWSVVRGIVTGWVVGPFSGITTGFVIYSILQALGAH